MQSQGEGHDLSGAATTYTHSAKSKCLYHLIDLITVLAFWISIYKTRLCKKKQKKSVIKFNRLFFLNGILLDVSQAHLSTCLHTIKSISKAVVKK